MKTIGLIGGILLGFPCYKFFHFSVVFLLQDLSTF